MVKSITGNCVAYGDCNTEGVTALTGPVWAARVADALGCTLTNCGHTMSTTRELLEYAKAYPPSDYSLAFIQYGLVDSWLTFRGAPYVLYYPDNPGRKVLRKLVKKIKKWARTWQLQRRLGAVEQVPLEEYLGNIRTVLHSAPRTRFILVATPPNLDLPRNPRIHQYNRALESLAGEEPNALYVDTYDLIWNAREQAIMSDGTHLSPEGHRMVAEEVVQLMSRDQTGFPAGRSKSAPSG